MFANKTTEREKYKNQTGKKGNNNKLWGNWTNKMPTRKN